MSTNRFLLISVAITMIVATLHSTHGISSAIGEPGTGLSGTAHDFSAKGDMCIPCHQKAFDNADASSAHNFTDPLNNSTIAESEICLGCHDGTVATNVWTASNYQTDNNKFTHHPVGVRYAADKGKSKGAYLRPASYRIGNGSIKDHLYNDKIECGTCHDVHNINAKGKHFLRVEDRQSALCFTCHAV